MDLDRTFSAGQTSGVWHRCGEWFEKALSTGLVRMRESGDGVEARGDTTEEELRSVAARAVTPDYPFEEFLELAAGDEELSAAVEERRGLRLSCSVEPFEGLICSVLSQNTSVERWRHVAERLSERFGEAVEGRHAFPSVESLASASENGVRECGAGYRAPYVLDAAEWVAEDGLDRVAELSTPEAREELMAINGVGEKVADCVLLYGLRRREAAPIDVHMMRRLCGGSYEECRDRLERYGEHAGLAQLYLYDHERRSS